MQNSLFICYTPLHAIIAKRIIEEERINNYSVLFFCATDNKKHRHYYEHVSSGSIFSKYEVIKKHPIKDFIFLRKFVKHIYGIGYDKNSTIYTGNIKIIYSRIIMYLMKPTRYMTFDDGSGNISNNGYFYTNDGILKSLVLKIVAPQLQYKILKSNMAKHYSIFNLPNVYENVCSISIFKPQMGSDAKDSLRILLTSPFSEDGEMDEESEKDLYHRIADRYHIDWVLPHPREKNRKIPITHIDTELVAEDYLNNLSNRYAITVYGIYSTALLTLNGAKGIEVVNIDANLRKPTDWLKSTFNKLGIPTDSTPQP